MNVIHAAYEAWIAADDAWATELHRQFGKNAVIARYTPDGSGRFDDGPDGLELRRLSASFDSCRDTYFALIEYNRELEAI